ncbi:hypothetical protein A2996_00165 [Candidatus Campbellbacteria bacterium RIFCSPLOWO2_01_FULL_34_15]|uniref:Peptidase S11 D-alanyl-D-alanine carboxypeptidase A N-terminal domain-containing protein n=2 Tax=Candidatus Campbelliibacteriota TaxID=1752727 RepID=A0A1F5ENV2_9BACT|nr:MAG: hypothetical protein A2996_00165 [Candidatus Campbellbacteria bacterium RIFCSPLOWO2_01_FULL_34_15]OGD69105.1 MAG: hypothetical protein A2811_02280 [Candidatus Campbellbacteria bacterium RIFCSPHIGHO2_01_FULL_34_10]
MNNMNFFDDKKRIILIAVSVIIFIMVIVLLWIFWKNNENKKLEENAGVVTKTEKNYFKDISGELEAKSAFVFDAKTGEILFQKNAETQLPLASLTKLMTVLVSSELVSKDTVITIRQEDLNIEGDNGLLVGENLKFKNVSDMTLTASSNDGAHALASVIGYIRLKDGEKTEREMFIDEMNKKAKEIGLAQTFFLNESGLDESDLVSGAYGSAKDMAFLMNHIIKNNYKLIEATKYPVLRISSDNKNHLFENTNQFVENIPGIIGSKTGFTDLAGGNLVVVFDVGIGHPIIVSVLGSSKEGRFDDVIKLVNSSINQIAGIEE